MLTAIALNKVLKGSKVLDEVYGFGWKDVINRGYINVMDIYDCPLGQLSGVFYNLPDMLINVIEEHGEHLLIEVQRSYERPTVLYSILDDEYADKEQRT